MAFCAGPEILRGNFLYCRLLQFFFQNVPPRAEGVGLGGGASAEDLKTIYKENKKDTGKKNSSRCLLCVYCFL
jgi:hypothetical protein